MLSGVGGVPLGQSATLAIATTQDFVSLLVS